ncbi:MAG TPA: RNA polymerase sigma factor [Candidatus Saccharimonadales bacterium]|nr:RNA polymerase sigma factor [Candidatus Saccharimonadales bacterium]
MTDERSLIRRCRQQDEEAFEALVRLKRGKVFRIALNIVGDEDDAKDITQLAFVRLWRSLPSFRESERFDPWFFRIVVNLSLDHYRRSRRAPRASGSAAVEPPANPGPMDAEQDSALYRQEIRRIFNEAARDLTPPQRAAFTLREIEGLGTEDTARAMGIRASTVRNHILQARRRLREFLRRRYPEIFREPR